MLAALAFGAFWYTMPSPRPTLSECTEPTQAPALAAAWADLAATTAERLYHNRLGVYGWSNRAAQHLSDIRHASEDLAAYLFGSTRSPETVNPRYQARVGAPIWETALIYYLRDALRMSDCAAARLVPDSAHDSVDEAEAKLRHILTALGQPIPR